MDTWKGCAWFQCNKRFEPARHANQHRHAGGQLHDGALYCSRACQQKAYRLRRDGGSATVTPSPVEAAKTPAGTEVHATVTPTKISKPFHKVTVPKNGHARQPLSTRAGKILPDAKWPGMWRVQWRSGRLSDMVNYTRAADALREASA
jgi:hypothetical protein